MLKFNRTYKLSIQDTNGDPIILNDPITLDFAIQRGMQSSTQKATFKLTNLDPATRNRLFKDSYNIEDYRKVILEAGYGGINPIVFQGNVVKARSYRTGGSTEFITEIEAYDGGWDFTNGYFQQTYGENTTYRQVIQDLFNSFSFVRTGIISDFDGTFPRGATISNKTVYTLYNLTGNRFFIDLERAYALKDGDAIEGDIIVINQDSGLLGTPKRQDTYLEVEILFEPRIKLGQLVEVNSSTVSIYDGIYQVVGFSHFGTISGAVGGVCKTVISLYIGGQAFRTLIGAGEALSGV